MQFLLPPAIARWFEQSGSATGTPFGALDSDPTHLSVYFAIKTRGVVLTAARQPI